MRCACRALLICQVVGTEGCLPSSFKKLAVEELRGYVFAIAETSVLLQQEISAEDIQKVVDACKEKELPKPILLTGKHIQGYITFGMRWCQDAIEKTQKLIPNMAVEA